MVALHFAMILEYREAMQVGNPDVLADRMAKIETIKLVLVLQSGALEYSMCFILL